jgi:hypothetical protein
MSSLHPDSISTSNYLLSTSKMVRKRISLADNPYRLTHLSFIWWQRVYRLPVFQRNVFQIPASRDDSGKLPTQRQCSIFEYCRFVIFAEGDTPKHT